MSAEEIPIDSDETDDIIIAPDVVADAVRTINCSCNGNYLWLRGHMLDEGVSYGRCRERSC